MPTLRQNSDRCRCALCGEFFSSAYAFDQHRTGTIATAARRCRSPAELLSRDWYVNAAGFWTRGGNARQLRACRRHVTIAASPMVRAGVGLATAGDGILR